MRKRFFAPEKALLLSIFLAGCFLVDNHPPPRDSGQLLSLIYSSDSLVQDSAHRELENFLFFKTDLPNIYSAIEKGVQETDPDDQLLSLLAILEDVNDETTPEFISKIYPQLENADLRAKALKVLATQGTQISLEKMALLILDNPSKLKGNERDLFEPLIDDPQGIAWVFPTLMALTEHPSFRLPLIELIHTGLVGGSLSPQLVQENVDLFMTLYQNIPKNPQKTLTASDMEKLRLADLILNCLAFYPEHPAINQLLTSSLEENLPTIQLAAISACLKGNIPVSTERIEALAQNPSTRLGLYQLSANYPFSFPSNYLNQKSFAEADLAVWLESQGKFADKFRFWDRITLKEETQGNVYLFEYRYGHRWLVGISGPQPLDSTKIIEAGYLTGSKFLPKGNRDAENWVSVFLAE